jgi:general secretion pathway protein K
LLGAFNDSEGAKDFTGSVGVDMGGGKNLGMPGGRFELVIVDEDSKIDANLGASNDIAHIRLAKQLMGLMSAPIYDPMFQKADATGNVNDRLSICSALIDWADPDDNLFSCDLSSNSAPSGQAKEDAYYQLLQKPYFRKNAPFDSLEELHMVRGITDDFWTTFVDPDPTNPKKRVLTVWGQGAVNVNTANPLTLLGLICSAAKPGTAPASSSSSSPLGITPSVATAAPIATSNTTPAAGVNPNLPAICSDPNQTALFTMGMTMAKGITMGAPLFGSPGDFISMMKGQGMLGPLLTAMGMQPVSFTSESDFKKSITTESKMFSIYAVGVVKGYKRETRLSVHEVVDFRTAPIVSAAPSSSAAIPAGSAAPPVQPVGSSSASPDATALAASMQPSTGGQVVYFHIE